MDKNKKKNPIYISPLSLDDNISNGGNILNNKHDKLYEKKDKNIQDTNSSISSILIKNNYKINDDNTINSNNSNINKTEMDNDYNYENSMPNYDNDEYFEQFKNESQFFENYVLSQTQQSTYLSNNMVSDFNYSADKNYNSSQKNDTDKNDNITNKKEFFQNSFNIINKQLKVINEKLNNNLEDDNEINVRFYIIFYIYLLLCKTYI